MMSSLVFFACDLPKAPQITCNGVVTFNNSGIEGVEIKSTVKQYAITNQNGEFSFDINSNQITIFPQKEGYIFTPEKAVITPGENNVNFVASQIENLTGKISLNKLIIKPTSIVSFNDNYVYINEGYESLKVSDISVVSGEEAFVIAENVYLQKSHNNPIYLTDEIVFDCPAQFSMGILINAYCTNRYGQEFKTTDDKPVYLYVEQPQTNAILKNGTIEYTLFGINNKTKAFTFDITFVFDYSE